MPLAGFFSRGRHFNSKGAIDMDKGWMIVVGAMLASGVAAAQEAPALKTQKDKISYALGMDLGNQLRKQAIEVDPALFGQGLKDALAGGEMLLTEKEARDAILVLQADLKTKEAGKRKDPDETNAGNDAETALLAAYNKRAGDEFLAENKKKDGVVTLPSGLQYKILKAGDGKKPTEADTVVCHYRGMLANGTEIDSSYQRNQPATFSVKSVIPGWREALQLMAVGSKYQLFIPPELAYGERGTERGIGPNATVLFEVELLDIK
jgi:FKBP-type peptidyl-prolyl cis-trans isomerase